METLGSKRKINLAEVKQLEFERAFPGWVIGALSGLALDLFIYGIMKVPIVRSN